MTNDSLLGYKHNIRRQILKFENQETPRTGSGIDETKLYHPNPSEQTASILFLSLWYPIPDRNGSVFFGSAPRRSVIYCFRLEMIFHVPTAFPNTRIVISA